MLGGGLCALGRQAPRPLSNAGSESTTCLTREFGCAHRSRWPGLARTLAKRYDRVACQRRLVERNADGVLPTCYEVTVLVNGSVLVTGTPDEVHHHSGVHEAHHGERSNQVRLMLNHSVVEKRESR
jgi:hypothetical protein